MSAVILDALLQWAGVQPFSHLQMTSSCFNFKKLIPIGLQI